MRYSLEHNINHPGQKPYNQCIDCPDIGVSCDGPNFLAMSPERRAEWSRIRKEYLHRQDPKWTNTYIAEKAGVSKVTVDRFMAGTGGDLRISTIETILQVLVNGSWGQYPCANPIANRSPEDQSREVLRLQAIIEDLRREHQVNLSTEVDNHRRQVDFLKSRIERLDGQISRKDKFLTAFSVGFFLAVSVIIISIIADYMMPAVGFIWR